MVQRIMLIKGIGLFGDGGIVAYRSMAPSSCSLAFLYAPQSHSTCPVSLVKMFTLELFQFH